jgi:hypothetical protein
MSLWPRSTGAAPPKEDMGGKGAFVWFRGGFEIRDSGFCVDQILDNLETLEDLKGIIVRIEAFRLHGNEFIREIDDCRRKILKQVFSSACVANLPMIQSAVDQTPCVVIPAILRKPYEKVGSDFRQTMKHRIVNGARGPAQILLRRFDRSTTFLNYFIGACQKAI